MTIERVAFPKSGYCTFDIEPNSSTEVGRQHQLPVQHGGDVEQLVPRRRWRGRIRGQRRDGQRQHGSAGRTLLTIIDLARRQNVVFTNNTLAVTASGPVLRFAHIDGLTVTGNVQPLTSGVLASITDSTGVTYH